MIQPVAEVTRAKWEALYDNYRHRASRESTFAVPDGFFLFSFLSSITPPFPFSVLLPIDISTVPS